jgi:hypothetical protein
MLTPHCFHKDRCIWCGKTKKACESVPNKGCKYNLWGGKASAGKDK